MCICRAIGDYFNVLLMVKKIFKSIVADFTGMFCGIIGGGALKKTLVIFVYHDISDNSSEFSCAYKLNITPKIFNFQINFIKNNFNLISPDDLLNNKIPPKAALITFDDGFRSYFTNALPILEKHQLPSIIFLNMEPIKGGLFWAGLIAYLCSRREDFRNYIKQNVPKQDLRHKSLFLFCNRKLVKDYFLKTGNSFDKEALAFAGEFAAEKDLQEVSHNPLVFFGNHLYNHDIPLSLSNEELLESYFKNDEELKRYANYRNIFSFPFGQPDTCYCQEEAELLLSKGVRRIFSSSGCINSNINSFVLDRIALSSFNNSASKIWFQVFRNGLFRNKRK